MKPNPSRRESVRLGELWKQLAEMGMSEREIICLQDGMPNRELATMWGVGVGRIYQIRAKAIRKVTHPWRIRLAVELGLSEKIGLSPEEVKRHKQVSLNDALSSYWKFKQKPAEEDEDEV